MSTLTLELPDELAARLEATSTQRQVPPAQIVREALENALPGSSSAELQPGPSAYDVLKDLVGCVDSGRTDLATNPKHMEGFGQWRR
ncbi:MAG: hypothetical protein IH623_25870 [Verrucomicrobia bacterium]|nr:hypothetical protein [Verrucomicrobiota bacterium]